MTATTLWSGPGHSLDHCRLSPTGSGFRLTGTVLRAGPGGPHEIRYSVGVDQAWRTRVVGVHIQDPHRELRIALSSDGAGSWTGEGDHVADFDGCLDVDLEFTPATNLLPIRRLDLEVGESAEVEAVWVRFPERRVLRLPQRYTRTSEGGYRYESGSFSAPLTVDEHGLVIEYGDLWRRVESDDA